MPIHLLNLHSSKNGLARSNRRCKKDKIDVSSVGWFRVANRHICTVPITACRHVVDCLAANPPYSLNVTNRHKQQVQDSFRGGLLLSSGFTLQLY